MSNTRAEISYLGGIDDESKRVTLTGSSTIFEVVVGGKKKIRIVVDAGMFQGSTGDDIANMGVDERVLNADYLIVTHAHMDHSGRVPYLVKKGFKGKILMSELTKDQEVHMWIDYLNLTRNAIDFLTKKNNKLREDLKDAFFIIKFSNKRQNNKRQNYKKINQILVKRKYSSLDEAIKESSKLIDDFKNKRGLNSEKDIESVLEPIPELLYNEEDILKTNDLISVLNIGNEIELKKFNPIMDINDPRIDDLAYAFEIGNREKIPVATYLHGAIKSKLLLLREDLLRKIAENQQIDLFNSGIDLEKLDLQRKYEAAQRLIGFYQEKSKLGPNIDLSDFELANFNICKTEEKIKELGEISLNGELMNLLQLISFYKNNLEFLPIDENEVINLEKELLEKGIDGNDGLEKYLKNLSTVSLRSFSKDDINELSSVIRGFSENIDNNLEKNNFIFISSLKDFDPKYFLDIISLDKNKKIFILDSIKDELFSLLSVYLLDNKTKFNESEKIKQSLIDAFDLLDIVDGNDEIFISKNLNKYQSAKRYIKNFREKNIINPIVGEYDIDGILNSSNDLSNGVIEIKKLDDPRIYDLLFDSNKKYYIPQSFRKRIKEKLLKKINDIKIEQDIYNKNYKKYLDYKNFVEFYEAKLLLKQDNLDGLTEQNVLIFLKENNIINEEDFLNIKKPESFYNFSNSDLTKKLKEVKIISDLSELTSENQEKNIYLTKISDLEEIDIEKFFSSKIYIDISIKKQDISNFLLEKRKKLKELYDSKKIEYDLFLEKIITYFHISKSYETIRKGLYSDENISAARALISKYSISNRNDLINFNINGFEGKYIIFDLKSIKNRFDYVDSNFDLSSGLNIIYISSLEDSRILDLPFIYNDSKTIIYVKDSIKKDLIEKLKNILSSINIDRNLINSIRKEYSTKLSRLNFLKENEKYLKNLPNGLNATQFLDFLNSRLSEIKKLKELILKAIDLKLFLGEKEVLLSNIEELYNSSISFLESYSDLINNLNLKYKSKNDLPFSINSLDGVIENLKRVDIEKNQDVLERIKLRFFDAGHIEGSVQALLSLVVSNVKKVLEINNGDKREYSFRNFLFTGDLGRIKQPNLTGSPEVPSIDGVPIKLDFVNIETTYAGRLHKSREESIGKLISSINNATGKVLIPVFSMQRTQEILVILLQKIQDSLSEFPKVRKINVEINKKRSERKRILSNKKILDKEIAKLVEDLKKSNVNFELSNEYNKKISKLYNLIDLINTIDFDIYELEKSKPEIFDIDIILDSPLSQKITEIYLQKGGGKYSLLDPNVQKRLFGRQVVNFLKGKDGFDELYNQKNKNKKAVILSSSGMCQGGSIIPHLFENLPNPNSTITFVGYCPSSTIGGKIKNMDPEINIYGDLYKLFCNVVDIGGFSGHPDEEEIITYLSTLSIAKGGVISLNHGGKSRNELSKKLGNELLRVKKFVGEILIPKLGETIKVPVF